MSKSINRRKTAMVLHEIETSLGNFVLDTEVYTENFPEEVVQYIAQRELEKNRTINTSKPRDIIEATYLDELFQILIEITKDTSTCKFIEKLKQLFMLYDIYEIRNIISHPNRLFVDAYWYKVAALASDPTIEILGMDQVRKALDSAERGEITDPPEDWSKKSLWEIPNNLPESFEHAITGLVGRQKEASDLLALIRNPRINNIAIVAPGGIGKTALVLDLLSSQVKIPETKKYIDSCIFITLKTEKLTQAGVVKLDAAETITELKSQITSEAKKTFNEEFLDFDALQTSKASERLLLFIDNLETLLIDSQEDFHEFNNNLPPAWRLLVTSRITINNASITTLEPLKAKSATHLARIYLGRKGGKTLDETLLSNLAKECHFNPLAIRLTIDLYVSGKEIPNSINIANKEIAGFSFSNLIENISKDSVKILEALFVTEHCTRTSLCELLNLSREDIAQAVSELSNTSLIFRTTNEDGEFFSLSDSIRELLLVNTRNILIREEIQSQITKQITLSKQIEADQIKQSIPDYHWEYIPKELNANLKLLLVELNKSTQKFKIRNDKAAALHRSFKEMEHLYDNESTFNRGYGRVLEALKANDLALEKYNKAISQNPCNPSSKVMAAMLHHNCGRYEKAHGIYKELREQGWDQEKAGDSSISYLVLNGFFLSLLYDHRYDEILENTKKWKDYTSFRGLAGAYRATAWKRKAENLAHTDVDTAIDYITRSMRILDDVFNKDGYIKPACIQAKNIFNEIAYILRGRATSGYPDFSKEALEFINKHLTNTVGHVNYNADDYVITLVEKLSSIQIPENPFKKQHWLNLSDGGDVEGIDLAETRKRNLTITTVIRVPKGKGNGNSPSTFIFSEDHLRNEYFLHYDQLKNGTWENWKNITTGLKLAVLPSENSRNANKATTVNEIYFTDLD